MARRQQAAVAPNLGGPLLGRVTPVYEYAERTKGVAHGGIGVLTRVVAAAGLAGQIDAAVHLLKRHRPYHESDHVLNLAYNALCGGVRLDDIEARRADRVFCDALGVPTLPDPTTAGDFCRRFDARRSRPCKTRSTGPGRGSGQSRTLPSSPIPPGSTRTPRWCPPTGRARRE